MRKQNRKNPAGHTISLKDDHRIALFIMLDRTRDIVVHAVELELKQYDINSSQAKLLSILFQENREMTLHELSQWVIRKLNSVSNLVNKLENRGLVKKLKRSGKEKTLVTLTEKGRKFFNEEVTEHSIHLIFDSLSPEEREQLSALLEKVQNKTRDLLGIDYKPPFLS